MYVTTGKKSKRKMIDILNRFSFHIKETIEDYINVQKIRLNLMID